GTMVGGYLLERVVAQGGFGRVYEGRHLVLQRRVAVKVLHASLAESTKVVERFVLEARAVNEIRHASIVDIFEFGHLPDGRPCYVMEYIDGLSLDLWVARHGRLSPGDCVEVLRPVCEALHAAHESGFIHRQAYAKSACSGIPQSNSCITAYGQIQ